MKLFPKSLLATIFVLVLSYWAIKSLFVPGFFPSHDDTAPARVYEMAKALSYGQFPVRWVPDLGYGFGYPLFNFYAPLPYYIGGFFNLAGFSSIASTKIMFTIGILLAGISMYFLIREVVGNIAALVSGIIYLYSPYHAVNIYVRGAVDEYYAYGFLPLFFLGIYKIIAKKEFKKGILIGSLGFAGILLSHNILGLITGYFIAVGLVFYFIWSLLRRKSFQVFYILLGTVSLGFGLSSFFIVPALVEKNYTQVEKLTQNGSDFHNHFVYLDQLWNSPWGYGGSTSGREDGMSFKIGKLHLLFGLASFVLFLFFLRKTMHKNGLSYLSYSSIVVLIISVFLMLAPSSFVWELLPGFPYIQYPWRFLNFVIFSLSMLASFIFLPLKKPYLSVAAAAGIIFLILWFNIKYFVPREYLSLQDEDYTSSLNLRYKISKVSDEYLPTLFPPVIAPSETAQESLSSTLGVVVKTDVDYPTFKKYELRVSQPTSLVTNIAFFPGWQAFIDGKKVNILDNRGRIELPLPSGQSQLTLIFKDTLVRIVANTISVFSIFLLVYVSLFWKGLSYGKKKFEQN